MVTIKNAEVLSAIMGLNDMMGEKLPAKIAFKVRKLHKSLSNSWEIVEEVRKSLIDQYAERDAEGEKVKGEQKDGQETVKIAPESQADFQAAWTELLAVEVEINDTISLVDLGDKEITPAIAIGLGDLLTEA